MKFSLIIDRLLAWIFRFTMLFWGLLPRTNQRKLNCLIHLLPISFLVSENVQHAFVLSEKRVKMNARFRRRGITDQAKL